jgi:hypothetical protein
MSQVPSIRINSISQSDSVALEAWDRFVQRTPRGHYCQLSTWLASFRAYGFRFEVVAARDTTSNEIVGGAGVLQFRLFGLNVASVPFGPIIEESHEHQLGTVTEALAARSESAGAAFLQVQFPFAADAHSPRIPALPLSTPAPTGRAPRSGTLMRIGVAPSQLLLVDLAFPPGAEPWESQMLARFSSNATRDIRRSERNDLELRCPTSEADLRATYALIESNGLEHGYATRSWNDVGPTIIEQVRRGHARMLAAEHQGRLLGAHYGVIAGKRYSYVMGGTVRTVPDLLVGRFLHWRAILAAHELGCLSYDLTSGGSPGVLRFKMSFRPIHIKLAPPVFFTFRRLSTLAFQKAYAFAHKHKTRIANVLSRVQRVVKR